MIRLILTAALALATAAAAAADAVDLTPGLVPGRTLRYDVSFTLERSLSLGAGRDRLVQEAGLTLTIDSVDDEGVATVTGGFEWVVIDLDRASFRVRVDTRDIQGDSPNKAETTIRELAGHYLEGPFSARVAPDGTVLELTGLDPVVEFVGTTDGTLARLAAGRLLPPTMARDLEPIWHADGAVGQALGEGDGWTATRLSPLLGPISVKLETPYLVTSADDDALVATGDVGISMDLPEGIEMPITFAIEDASGSATIAWDVALGAVRSREATTAYTMILEAPDGKQGSQRSARSVITLVSSEDAGG